MQHMVLKLTEFRVQKLKCIGDEGSASPYKVTTTSGQTLGTMIEKTQAAKDRRPASGIRQRLELPRLTLNADNTARKLDFVSAQPEASNTSARIERFAQNNRHELDF